jgi:hypothetical protein
VPDHDNRRFFVRAVPFEFYQIACGQLFVNGNFGAYGNADTPLEAFAQAVDTGKMNIDSHANSK